ncbi:hypothetical protein P3T24_006606 [Paraburkholderia sp. GAS33]|uniref:hypothetical protein n=1 Tax=Paraburkholderia sp. GAS33 TaxID=3035130 RepID=UPI003D24F298
MTTRTDGSTPTVLRGWLLDTEDDPDTHSPYRFLAHSVVLTARGNLIDVTLPATERSRRFLVHPYGICGFFAVLCRVGLDHPAHEFRVESAALSDALEAGRDFTADGPTAGDCL